MKSSTLPGIMQKNVISADIYLSVRSFAGNISNSQNLMTNCNYRAKWHNVSLVWLIILGFFLAGASQAFGQITQRGSATTSTGTNTITIDKPTGIVAGDVLIVNIVQNETNNNNLNNSSLTGWTLIDGRLTYDEGNFNGANAWWGTVLYRVADGTEGASFTFNNDNDADMSIGSIVAFYNVASTGGVNADGSAGGPFDVDPGTINLANSSTVTANGITTATPNAAIIMLAHVANDRTYSGWSTTSPGTLTELYENTTTNTDDASVGAAWALKPTSGVTGNGTVTLTGGDRNGGILIALRAPQPPTIIGFSPSSACTGSGTSVVITGTGFTGASAVTFYNGQTATFVVNSSTQITATLPAGASTGTISVTTPVGTGTSGSSFTVNALPSVAPIADGASEVCVNSTTPAFTNATGGGNWSITPVSGTASITSGGVVTGLSAGIVTVVYTYSDGTCSNTAPTSLTVNPLPVVAPITGGALGVCVATTTPQFLNATTGGSWSILNGSGSATITTDGYVTGVTPGTVTVVYTYSDGTCSNTATVGLNVNDVTFVVDETTVYSNSPATAPLCAGPGSTLILTAPDGGNTYRWTGPNGFESFDQNPEIPNVPIEAAGPYFVFIYNECFPDPPGFATIVALNERPVPTLTGPTPVCATSTDNVYTTEAGNDNYVWTIQGGTITSGGTLADNTATVTWNIAGAQYISVNYEDPLTQCSAIPATQYDVTVNPLPVTPGTITGPATVCPNATGIQYSISAVGGAIDYTWTLPAGWSLISGQGTTSITVSPVDQAGDVIVVANNSCGSSAQRTLTVTVEVANDIGFNGNFNTNVLSICSGSTGTTINGGNPTNSQDFLWQVSTTDPSGPFSTVSPNPGDVDNWTISNTYYNVPGVYYFRRVISNNTGCNGNSDVVTLTVNSRPSPTITGNNLACPGTSQTYTTSAGQSNYAWTHSTGGSITAGGGINDDFVTITWTQSGARYVRVNYTDLNGCNAINSTQYNVTVNAAPVAIAGNDSPVCNGYNLHLTSSGGVSYLWSGPNDFSSIAKDPVIIGVTTLASGIYTVTVTDANGCTAIATTNVSIVYSIDVEMFSNSPICEGTDLNLSATSGGTSYEWRDPDDNIISTTAVPTLTVNGLNAANTGMYFVTVSTPTCGDVITATSVTINPPPVPNISGPSSTCPSASGDVYTTDSGMTNYLWAVSAGGTIIGGGTPADITATVLWSAPGTQTVSLTYTDANGCTGTSSYDVTVILPYISSGPESACAGSIDNVYTAEAGMTNYIWTLSTGGTITSGGGATDNTATITWNTSGAQWVGVNYTTPDLCTAISPFILNVTVNPRPVPTISGTAIACLEGLTGYTYTTQAGMAGYVWTVSAGGTITSGAGTNSVTIAWNTLGAQSVSVNYTNANGCSATVPTTYPVTVNPRPVPTISGPDAVCNGLTGVFTTESSMTSYTWGISGGASIISGAGTNSVTIRFTSTGDKFITVNYTNPALCRGVTATVKQVTVNALPDPTITGPTPVCLNSTGNVYTTQAGNSGYSWTISGGIITSGAGTNAVTVTWTSATATSLGVNYINSTGCTAVSPSTLNVSVIPLPSTTGSTITYGQTGSNGALTYTSICSSVNGLAGPFNPSTGQSIIGPGTDWVTPSNISSVGSPYTTAFNIGSNGGTSDYLRGSGYGFNIPTGAIITGIEVVINRISETSAMIDNRVSLVKPGGIVQTTNKATTNPWTTTDFSTATYGGQTDLWGNTWTLAEINNADFGVVLSAMNTRPSGSRDATVDYMQITVYYTLPGTIQWYSAVTGGSPIFTGNPFNTLLEAVSGLDNFTMPGAYTFYTVCSNAPDCRAPATLLIERAEQTISWATPATIPYGTPLSATQLNATVAGILGGEPGGALTYTPDLGTILDAGTHTLTVHAAETQYYNAKEMTVDIVVTKANLTVTADNQTKVYGAANPPLTFQYSGWVNGVEVIDVEPTTATTVTTSTVVGTYPGSITLSGGSDNNYTFSFVAGDFDVTRAVLTVTADSKTKVYGTANPPLTFSYSGWVNGVEAIDVEPTISTTVTTTTPVGTYLGSITFTGGSDNNYTLSFVDGDFDVTKAVLAVTAESKTKVYGAANPPLTFLYSGWVNGVETIDVEPVISTTVTTTTNVGNYPGSITFTGGSDDNYTFSFVAGDFEVTKAVLTVTADNQTKAYGASNPPLTFQYSGWVNGVEVIDVEPTAATTVTTSTVVGTYPGSITLSGGSDNNYTFSFVAGDFDVTRAVLTVTADSKTKVYGTSNPPLTFSYSGWVNGVEAIDVEPTISTTVTTTTPVGTYLGSITFTGGSDDNYTLSFVDGDFEVTKAVLTVTADSKTKVYGAANPPLTFQYSGWVNGVETIDVEPTISTTVTTTTPVGTYLGSITFTGGLDNNYTFSFVAGDFEVTKAVLTVTADNQTKAYGTANPPLTFQYSGWVNGVETIDVEPTAATTVTTTTVVGTYPGSITLSGGSDNNYTFSFVAGDFEVTKAVLTVTADSKTKVYGAANPPLTFSYSGWVNGVEVIDVEPTISTTVTTTTPVGTYLGSITFTGGLDNNYTFSFVAGDFDVTRAVLTVTADSKTKVYGAANPPLTFQYSGWVNGIETIDVEPTAATTVTTTTVVGTYPGSITLSGGSDNNYTFSFVAGDFEVTRAVLTVTADSKTKVYGAANPPLTFQYSGWVNGVETIDVEPTAATTVTTTTVVGTYPGSITLSGGSDNNYTFSFVAGDFEVTKAVLTLTADSKTKVYGAANPPLTFSYSGWVNGVEVIDVEPTISTTVTTTTPVGTYLGSITFTGGLDNNYTFSFVAGDFEVTKAVLTVTADSKTKVYGAANPPLTFQYSGWVNGIETIDVEPTAATTVTTSTVVGTYPGSITLSGGSDNNYTFSFVAGDFEVTRAVLTVTADSKTKVYGAANPPLTFQYSGWVNGVETIDVEPTAATTVTTTTVVGTYPGSITLSGGSDNNYTFSFVAGDFEVTKAVLTVTADSKTKVYGAANPPLTFSYSGWVNGVEVIDVEPTISTTVTTTTPVGTYLGSITFTGGLDNNYTFSFVAGDFDVTRAVLTVTADSKTKVYGAANPPLTFQYSGWVNGIETIDVEPTAATTVTTTTVVGTYPGSITLSGGSDNNYTFSFVAGDFEVTKAVLTVTADNQTKVYGAANPPLTFQYSGWVNGVETIDVEPTAATTVTTTTVVGTYPGSITLSGGSDNNYTFSFVAGDFEVTKAVLTVTADSKTKVYGAANPPLTFQYSGWVNGIETIDVEPTAATTVTTTTVVGTYPGSITLSGGSDNNYTFSFVAGDFEVTKAVLTVTADNQTKVYGAANPPLTFQYSGWVNGIETIDVAPTASTTVTNATNVGSYPGSITLSGGSDNNYTFSFVMGDFEVTEALITVTADIQAKIYGAVDPLLTYQITSGALVGTDAFVGELTRDTGENVGTYAITQGTLALSSNYILTYLGANLTITAMPITVTANSSQTKVYGAVDPLVYTYTSVPTGLLPNGATVSFTGALSRVAGENVGLHAITQGGLANGNYTITFVPADFTITALPVTVTANAGQNKVYGAVDPLVYTYTSVPTGLLPNGATVSFTGALNRVAGENVGGYAIQQGTLANSNYTITFVTDDFTITPLAVTVTANAGQTKVYGAVEPVAFTYSSVPSGLLPNGATVAFTGSLSRVAGENIGNYGIQIGSLANSNYIITFVPANFTITPMTITVTASPGQTKVYGSADPVSFNYVSAPAVGTILPNGTTVSFSGALIRAAGENVGPHSILQGTLANSNYNITFVSNNFVITARPITITADAKTKVYGTSDPALTYQITSGTLVGTDAFSGVLTRAAGENVGSYAILQGTLALSPNYTLSYVGANLVITTRAITVTADPQTKVYGTADPALTYQITSGSLAGNGDAFSGSLTRDPGQNIGAYFIRQGTLALNSNYTLTYIGANLTITPRAITVTANAQTKVYGNADPVLTYQITSGSLAGTDSFTGSLTRDPGENIGVYSIRRGSLALNSNYTLTYVGADLTITIRSITITADPKTKIYGDSDPLLTYQITSGSLASNGDAFSGSLTRDPGEDAGTYAITQGTLGLGSNYDLTYIGANLTIVTSSVTVTADNSAKVYGDDDNLTYQITSGSLLGTDTFTGSLSHDGGEDVGTHPITQGTLALSSNYTLTFIGATLTITPRPVTVTANTLSKVYGDSDPMLTYSVTSGSLALGDTFSGAMIRDAGENAGDYAISQGDLALNSNYILTFVGANFTITPRPITVTADPKLKIYGEADPELTYQITSGNLAGNGDAFTGGLTRDPGEDVGIYAITLGTLSLSSNYTLTYVGADLNIIRSSVAINVAADPLTKVYGEADPELTYEIISGALVGTDTFTGELTREPGENVGTYAILQGTLALSANYDLVFTVADFTITSRPITVTADSKSKVFGESDPELTYEITSGELVANGDAFTGGLTRDPGEDVGVYAITQGTLSLGDNYDITFEEAVLNITAGFEMKTYPNPFADHIWFEFDLNNDSEVLLEIYNIIGVKIATVFKGNLTADHYRFEFLPEHMSEGVVIYKLSINGHEMVVGKAIHKK